MSNVRPFDEARAELSELIKTGDAALVIGAGASITSGGPTSRQLVAGMRDAFPQAAIKADASFLDAGTEVCDTPPYGRQKLVRYIVEQLAGLAPSDAYRQLPRVLWRAIFTTNYDDLIEKVYASPSRQQSLQPVNLPYPGNQLPRANHTLLFYLQGSIRQPVTSDGSPVVSWGDYLRTVQDRQPCMDTFRNVIAGGGSVIYVGYSFGDRFLDDLLDEALRRIGAPNMPYGYALLPEWPEGKAAAAARIQRKFVQPVEGSFEDLAALIEGLSKAGEVGSATARMPSPAAGEHLTLVKDRVTIAERNAAVISEAFDLLSDTELGHAKVEDVDVVRRAKAFLRGEDQTWSPYVHGWAFKRKAFADVWQAIVSEAEDHPSASGRLVLVHGPAGLGKSVMARQLALEAYTRKGWIVLIAKPGWRARPEVGSVERVLTDIETEIEEGKPIPQALLIVDEAELFDHTVAPRLIKQTQGFGRVLHVALFARTNEYFRVDKAGSVGRPDKWGELVEVRVSEQIDHDEAGQLVQHIIGLGIWGTKRTVDQKLLEAQVREDLDSSFFNTLYSLVEQTKDPLAEKAWSEYQNLGSLAQQAYLLIAATYQFGLPLKMEMLVRALDVSFARFEQEVIRTDAREILISEYATNYLNIYYRIRTRIVAKVVFDRALPNRDDQLALFEQIAGSVTPSAMFGLEEADLVRTLLVQVFGPRGYDGRFGPDQVNRLFMAATKAIEDDVLEHHYGLNERAAGNLDAARAHLEKALSLSVSAVAPGESVQNIQNSLAQVLGELALRAIKEGHNTEAGEYLDQAVRYFVAARSGEFPNAAAYDAHARLLARRAKLVFPVGSVERTLAIAEAVDVAAMGLDNVNDDYRQQLVELHATLLGDLGLGEQAIEQLMRGAQRLQPAQQARYELIAARVILGMAGRAEKKRLRQALTHATKASELDATYLEAWRLRAELYSRLHANDFRGITELLGKALRCPGAMDNLWLLYEQAVCQFYLEDYRESARLFDHLRKVSHGHVSGSRILEAAGERDGEEPFEFEGRVVRRTGDGRVIIECEALREFGGLWFNPRRQRQYEPRLYDIVSFTVGFNYRGLVAIDLRKT